MSDINVQTFSGKVNITSNLLVGSSHLFVDTTNNRVGITTRDPQASLDVNGDVNVGTNITFGGVLTGNGSGLTSVNSDSGLWTGAGTGSVYLATSTDSVGIGVTDPDSKLEVRGNIRASSSDTNHGIFIDAGGTILRDYGGNGAGLHFTANQIFPTNYLGAYSAGGIDLGSAAYRWNNVYTEALNASGTIDSTGIITCNANKMVITGSSPTLYLRDSDQRTGMIHQNADRMYFLTGPANSDSWVQTANSRWPLYLQMDTNEAVFGGNIDASVGTVTASTFTANSRINIGTSASIRQSSTSSWTGDPGSGVGKLEYHSNRWYIVAGSNSTELLQVRRNNTNKFTIDNNGSISLGTVPAARISGTVGTATNQSGGTVTCTSGTFSGTFAGSTASSRDKFRVYPTNQYCIGMQSGVTYGDLNDWSMTFQMNNENDRGFWWGDDGHGVNQGAMALSTRGWLNVAERIKVGGGQTDTGAAGWNLQVQGNAYISSTLEADGRIYADNGCHVRGDWLRVDGVNGIYFESYGGGWHMDDSSWVKSYNGKGVYTTGAFYTDGNRSVIRGDSPTLYFRDTNNNSAMWHCNSNLMYLLRGGNDTETWTTVGGAWPFICNLTNNKIDCGGDLTARGNVGIGTTSPVVPLHVNASGGAMSYNTRSYFTYGNSSVISNSGTFGAISIHATGNIITSLYFVAHAGTVTSSDSRIKKYITDIDDGAALETLRLLKPKQYRYKDVIGQGRDPVWGFIAQEVRDVLPYATFLRSECIPNIYELANVSQSNVITFTKYTTSSLNNDRSKIRLVGVDGKEVKVKIVEVIDDHTIRVDENLDEHTGYVNEDGNLEYSGPSFNTLTPEEYEALEDKSGYSLEDGAYVKTDIVKQIFVYGEEVDDFHVLKKDAIWTVATAALQEVDRQLQAEKTKTNNLETKVENLESLVASLVTRIENLE